MATKSHFGQCKCCLKETYLKNMWYTKKSKEVYGQMLVDCFAIDWMIKGNVEDDKICGACISKLQVAVNFKNQVLKNQAAILDSTEATIEEKIEHIEDETESQNEEEEKPKYIIAGDAEESAEEENEGEEGSDPLNDDESSQEENKRTKRGIKKKPYEDVEFLEEEVLETGADDSQDSDYEPVEKKSKWPKKLPPGERYRQYMQYTEEDMNTAIEAIKSNEMSVSQASGTFNIPRKSISKKLLNNTDGDHGWQKQEGEEKDSVTKHRDNMRSILVASNATPIKGHWGFGYACFYCPEQFNKPSQLKQHTYKHKDAIPCIKIKSLAEHILKLDVTDLKCNICDSKVDALDHLMLHLKDEHNMVVHMDIPNHIVPFSFVGDDLKCVKCNKKFETFKILLEHMHDAHYRNYVCVECRRGFVNIRSLKTHSIAHGLNVFACSYCLRVFYSRTDMVEHEKMHLKHSSPSDRGRKDSDSGDKIVSPVKYVTHGADASKTIYKCKKCPQIFENKSSLLYHINLAHKPHKCDICHASFDFQYSLKKHMVKEHPFNGYKCAECDKRFANEIRLKKHMTEHITLEYICEVCSSKFGDEETYLEHMKENHGLE